MKNLLNNFKKQLNNKKYRKTLISQKQKLYITPDFNSRKKYTSKRNKFKPFITKLKFENTFNEVKHLNLYYYLIGGFLLLCVFYVLFFSHIFYVKTIDVIRQDDTVNYNITYNSVDKYRYKSIFFIDTNEIRNSILSYQPNIKTIKIRKIFPSNLKITVASYDAKAMFVYDEKYYLITENGVVVPTTQRDDLNLLEIKGLDNVTFLEYKKYFDSEIIKVIDNLLTLVKENTAFIETQKIYYHTKEKELHIVDKNGIYFIFDLTKDPQVQIEKLNIFYTKYFKKIKDPLFYIDLRVNERIIYCDKSTENDCRKNIKYLYGY